MTVDEYAHYRFSFRVLDLNDLRVEKLGNSSVRYGIGLFRAGEAAPAAQGWFVHVFVDRASRRSTPIPERIRSVLERLVVEIAP